MGNVFRLFPEFGRKDNKYALFRTAYSDECWLIHQTHFLFVGLMFYPYFFFKLKNSGREFPLIFTERLIFFCHS
jgi:hypothetical protein